MPLDLLIPDLLSPADAPPPFRDLRLRELERWLAASAIERSRATSAADFLATAFGVPAPAAVAPIALAGEEAPTQGEWLRADPVHVRVAPNAATLYPPAALEIERAEAETLAAALSAHFSGDGLAFLAPAPERWYLRVPAGELPATTPLEAAIGQNAFALMPAATRAIKWPAVLTEAQMVLAAHEVNARREREGRPAINSVWLWGGGEAPAALSSPYASVYANEPFARGLARLSGARLSPVPAALGGVDGGDAKASVLVAIDALSRPRQRGDAERWKAEAAKLEETWFSGLARALAEFGGARLILPAASGTLVARLKKPPPWQWLRKPGALAAYG